ncbi:non-hydrolyzing UDP-N-acetylglucosamine 2-epimerase [Flavobacterium columnare]|uniref:non-hydrolyzing UDP-N-acetylglucosamine 2-epimerase n=1 Tax=Flavobacterium columnare TaxID=996 RepID=UPI00403423EC
MKTILLCFGTRPEAIKMAPIYHAFKDSDFDIKVCITAQHRQMLDQVVDFFDIKIDYDLNLMQKNQSLNQLSSKIIASIDEVLLLSKPELVLVHGDTTTSSMVALAAFHRNIKVGHIEAGLRTWNKQSPFPEEMNRQLTGRISDFHFTPTLQSKKNLIDEKVDEKSILITGNTVIDALNKGVNKIESGYTCDDLVYIKSIIKTNKKVLLITGHRRENFGKGFEDLCEAIANLAIDKEIQIIYPVHLNPNVQEPVYRILGALENVNLIKPVDYPAFIYLMQKSYVILTDSGGIQEEAPSLGKPVILMRDTTERPEAVESGTVLLVGTDKEKIITTVQQLLEDKALYHKMSKSYNPYGDGEASIKIVNFFKEYYTLI